MFKETVKIFEWLCYRVVVRSVLFSAVHQVKLADVVVDDFLNGGIFVELVYGVCNLWRKVEFLRALDFKLIVQYLFRK